MQHLADAGVVGIAEIDTRRLVRHIRNAGAMRGVISTETDDVDDLQRRAEEAVAMEGAELASEVSTTEPYESAATTEQRFRVVAYDFGIKGNIVDLLNAAGCHVTVVPATTPAQDVLAREPDGVFPLQRSRRPPRPCVPGLRQSPRSCPRRPRRSASASAINCWPRPLARRPTS